MSSVVDGGHGQLTVDLLCLIILVLNGGDEHSGGIREDQASRLEKLVASHEDGVKHRLVEKEVTHPLRYNNVKLFDGEFSLFDFTLDEGDDCEGISHILWE